MRVSLLARWGSRNVGDRWAPAALLRELLAAGVEVLPLSFAGETEPVELFDGATVPGPEAFAGGKVLAVVGSLSPGDVAAGVLARLLDRRDVDELFVWAGFQDVELDPPAPGWSPPFWRFLADPRVRLVVRSTWDRWLALRLGARPEAVRIGGDPLVALPDGEEPILGSRDGPTVAVVSARALSGGAGRSWFRVLEQADRVVVFDLVADRALHRSLGARLVDSPEAFWREVEDARLVVSARLHGALLALARGIPVVGGSVDGRPLGRGSSKVLAVGGTGLPDWRPAFATFRPEDEAPGFGVPLADWSAGSAYYWLSVRTVEELTRSACN